jgi:tetratricopeptide (TPR) repeat protein
MTEEVQAQQTTPDETPQAALDFIGSGWKQYAEGKYAQAEENFRKAIELDGRLLDAYYGLGVAQLRQGNPEKALEWLEKARNLTDEETVTANSAHRTMIHQLITAQISIIKGKH